MTEIRDDSEWCRRGRPLPKEEVDMTRSKKVLCVGSFEEQLKVARIINNLSNKVSQILGTADKKIEVTFEEAKLLSEIVVSSENFK
jgi:hypothetical protein